MGRKITVTLFCCLIIAVALMTINCSSAKPGKSAQDFELKNLDGETVSLSDYRGSPVMLNFWASWCGPCRSEMPYFQQVYEDTEWQAANLVILAVNIGESPSVVGGFTEDNGFTFPVLLDMTGAVAEMYNVRSIPATFFIDERGIIRYSDVGSFSSKAHLEQRLRDLFE
jgi:peroxiredoxin